MKDRHSKKELTRLILTALILGSGGLYGPVAEAVDIVISSTNDKDALEADTRLTVGADYVYSDNPNYSIVINGVHSDLTGYSFYGGGEVGMGAGNYKITLKGGTVNGLYGFMASGGLLSSGNKVYIHGGTVTNNVFGSSGIGLSAGKYNTIEINPTADDITIGGNVYGNHYSGGSASGNTVTIKGDATKIHMQNSVVYGGYCASNGTAQNNTIEINSGVELYGIVGAQRTGGEYYYYESDKGNNTLKLGASGIRVTGNGISNLKIKGVRGFETIAITSGVAFANDSTVLSVTSQIYSDGTNNNSGTYLPTLDITGATGLTGLTSTSNKLGTMTLVSASNSLATMKLKYSSAAAAATIPSTGVKVNSDTSTYNSAVNNINLAYKYDHTVKLANSNKSIQYNIANNVSTVSPSGAITWSNGGTARGLTDTTYTFSSATAADMSNLTFTGTITGNPLGATSATNQSMTLLSGIKDSNGSALTIASGKITQPETGKGTVATAYTTEDIVLNGTASGAVTAESGALKYTLNSVTLDSVNLAGWNGNTNDAGTVPTGWTKNANGISVTADTFTEPTTLAEGTSKEILSAGSDFFSDATIAEPIAYKSMGATFTGDEANGVTLSGNKAKGVLASTDGKKLLYNYGTKDATNIALGSMTWGTGRSITGTGYTFGNVTGVDATNLAFTFTNDQAGALAASSNMSLLSGATGLTAGKTVTYKNSGTNHTQAVSYSADNGATLSGTLTGTVSTAANAVNYQASSMTLGSIDLSSWNGTASSGLPTGWTKNGAISVSGNFTKPPLAAGASKDILTATSDYFSDANIDSAIAYQSSGAFSNAVNGVTLSGSRASGVKSTNSGKALTYFAEKNDTNTITFGQMAWGTSRTADSTYDFSGVTSIDASNLTFTGTATAADASTTLLTGATGLGTTAYTISPTTNTAVVDAAFTDTNGIAYTGKGNGAVSVSGTDVKFTLTGGTVNSINLNGWTGTENMTLTTNWTGTDIAVDTGNFAAQTTNKTLFTLDGVNSKFSGTVTGNRAYTSTGAAFTNEENGVTVAGSRTGGIKVEDDKTLKYYAETLAANTITLGNMTWGTGRTIGAGYTFAGVGDNGVDATGLSFGFAGTDANTIKANDTMELVTGATGLGAGLTVNGASHNQAVSYTATNGATLSGTLAGTVSTDMGKVNYKVDSKTLTGINLSGWDKDQAAVAVDGSWTKNLAANSINAAGFTAPTTLTAGDSIDILTTTTDNFFADAYITGAQKFAPGAVTTDEAQGVTFTGTQSKGVKASADGQKLVYAVDNFAVTGISLGNMTVGADGEVTPRAVTSGFDFSAAPTINATNLKFDKPANVADSPLVTGASGIIASNPITGAGHSQAITNAAIGTGGIKVSGTLNGTVSAVAGGVNYTVNNKTISSMDLSGWDTTTENTGLPNNKWTGSNVTVNANNFAADAPTENKTIFTTTTDGFFGNVTGDLAYTSGAAFSETGTEGITLSGTRSGGVKKSDDGSDLNFIAEARTVNNISLGNMTWGTGRTIGAGYTFASVGANGVDARGLSFGFTGTGANTIKASDTMELVTGATGLGAGLTVNGASHDQAVSYTATNGATLSGTLAGTVSTDVGKVKYTVDSKTLTGINLSGWDKDQAAVAVDGSWTKNLAANSINAAGFTAPTTLTAGDSIDILTTTTDNFFADAYITGAQKFAPGAVTTDEAQGVTFTGTQSKGVKAADNGQKLVYAVDNFAVTGISLGNMTVGADGVVTPRTVTSGFDFSAAPTINATNLKFDKPADVADSTLVTNAAGITTGNPVTGESHSQAITNAAMGGGITASGTLHGTVAAATNAVKYTVTDKTISSMDLSGWNGTTVSGLPNKWTGSNVAVSTGTFTAPTADKTIFTTDITNFFGDVTGDLAYKSGVAFSGDKVNGVTLSGTRSGGVKKSDDGKNLNFIAEARTVNNISLGDMAVGTGGTVTPRTADTNYTFNGSTINATNLKFNKPEDVADSTLVTNAAGITTGNTVTGASHSQAITNAAMGGGITASGTLHGTVAADTNAVKYTVTDKTISSMDLSGWNGTTVSGLPNKWTGSNVAVSTGTFTAPTGNKTIFTTNIEDFFGDVTGAMAYTSGAAFSETGTEGITLSGTRSGGVKKSDDGKNLNFIAEARTVNNIALGNMDWGTGRAITGNYDFSTVANNGVDASGLNFNFTGDTVNTIGSSTPVWNLVTGATGLNGGLTVKGSPVSQTVSYGINKVANLTGTLTGDVTTANHTVQYKVTGKTLDKVDISNWDGSTVNTALNTSWSKKDSGIAVTGSGFTAPTAVGDYNILTATPTGYFTGAQIADSIVYKTGSTFSETASNITLSGTQDRGVKVNDTGTALQYSIGKANINNIKVGNVTYTKDGTLIDKSASLYDYSQLNSNGLDISGFGLSMTDEQKKVAAANDSMTLVKANMTLNDIAAQEAGKSSYTYANTSATSDLTVKGTVTGNVAAANSNVVYTVASNTASALTINSMTWNSGTYARPDSEIAYSTALVNADNITFNGVDTLSKNDTMVLVSNYGDEVNKVRGGIFTLSNGKTGKGHAYYDSTTGNLVYVVDRGVDEEVETKTAIGTKTIIINEQPHQGDVPGGEAEGDGEAKDNETIIKKSHIKKNPDGTGGDTNGGTSEDGDADENKLDIEESEIDGDATGGQSDTGNTDDNETIIKKKSVIHGDVAGGETLGGHGGSRRNKTTVEESTVEGDVDGGKTGGDGETEENEVIITGSKIGGDVNGGHSGGDGDSSGNEVTVDNSTVDGDVNGGKSDGNGNTKNNKVDIKKGSKIGGSVHGGHSGGSGDSTGNEVTVDGSEVDGNVMGGRTKDGNANNNTVNIDGGSTINGSVYGGYSDTGDASDNNVNIGTGKINGDIYGGYSGGTGSTINNTVTLYGDADVSGSNIIGGSNGSTGNTLNIGKGTESWTGGGQTVKNISSFDTLNFTALPWNSDTPALTIGDGSATDLSNTTVTAQQVAFTGVKTISVGSTMMFLDQSNVAAGKKATNINSGSDFTVGTAMEGTGKLVLDANGNVIYQVENAGVSRQTHNTVMAAEAAVVALNAGNDFILSAREGLARKENVGKDGIAAYAKIGGSSIRQETGSHVNVNTWNGIVALGRKDVQKDSVFEYGAFIEHGLGNFTTHNDNAQRGDGSVDYTGGGLLGKWMNNQGLYVEGSLRVGRIHEKGNNLLRDTVRAYGYDERTTYKGFHLGVGKEFAIKDGNTVEVYGKYFYNRKDGMNFNAGLDEYNLDAVTSQILRVGARYTMKRERWNYYGDLSYEHELDGKAAGRANGMAIRGADTSGGSVRLELGAKLLANEKSPWSLDLNLTGYAGKKQGLQGGASVKFMF